MATSWVGWYTEVLDIVMRMNWDTVIPAEIPTVNKPIKGPLIQRKRVAKEIADSHKVLARVVCFKNGFSLVKMCLRFQSPVDISNRFATSGSSIGANIDAG